MQTAVDHNTTPAARDFSNVSVPGVQVSSMHNPTVESEGINITMMESVLEPGFPSGHEPFGPTRTLSLTPQHASAFARALLDAVASLPELKRAAAER
jgi:hypothetical protein